eukprot:752406-Hanusia_phi.AAC.2
MTADREEQQRVRLFQEVCLDDNRVDEGSTRSFIHPSPMSADMLYQQQLVAQESWHPSAYRIQGDCLRMQMNALSNSNLQKCYVRDYTVLAKTRLSELNGLIDENSMAAASAEILDDSTTDGCNLTMTVNLVLREVRV